MLMVLLTVAADDDLYQCEGYGAVSNGGGTRAIHFLWGMGIQFGSLAQVRIHSEVKEL
jgi:hypothetical protein